MRSRRASTTHLALSIIGGLLIALPPCVALAGDPPAATQASLFRDGCRALREGRTDDAIRDLSAAFAKQPQECTCGIALARALAAAGRWSDAEQTLERTHERFPDQPEVPLAVVDLAIDRRQLVAARAKADALRARLGDDPRVTFRIARIHFERAEYLGEAQEREVEGAEVGNIVDGWLIVQRRGPSTALCAPAESALYQIRSAIAGGFDSPAAHVLHARIWAAIRRPDVGYKLLKDREPALLTDPDDETLRAYADLALATADVGAFLTYSQRRATAAPARAPLILKDTYLAAARHYAATGEPQAHAEWLRRAVALDENDVELLVKAADAEWDLERIVAAADYYQKALRRAPHHPDRDRILQRIASAGPTTRP